MKKAIVVTLFLFIIVIMLSGCSARYNINTKSVNILKNDLLVLSDSIKSVKITFIRPQLDIDIDMADQPTEETLNNILATVKLFTSVENMQEIADEVGWNDYIWEVYLNINTDKNRENPEHTFFARYLNSVDHSDQSEKNIDAYKTWHKSESSANQERAMQEAIELRGKEIKSILHVEEINEGALVFFTRKPPSDSYDLEVAFLQKLSTGWKWVNGGGHAGGYPEGFSYQYCPNINGNSLNLLFGEIKNLGIKEIKVYEPKELLESRQGLGEKAKIVTTEISAKEKMAIWFVIPNIAKGSKLEIMGLSGDGALLGQAQIDFDVQGIGKTEKLNNDSQKTYK